MSGANSNSPPGPNGGADPSMEDILASIRRILAEDEPAPDAQAAATETPPTPPAIQEDVLVLDVSMLAPVAPATPAPADVVPPVVAREAEAEPVILVPANPVTSSGDDGAPLVIRNTLPCFEDVVRAAFEPVIRQWADVALPKLVERLVRTEVERVVGSVV